MIAQFHLALFDRLALHDENFVSAEEVGGGALWDGQDRIYLVRLEHGFDEGAGFEFAAVVGDQRLDFEGTRLLVHRRIDARDASAEFAPWKGFERERDCAAYAHPGRHLLWHVQAHTQWVN